MKRVLIRLPNWLGDVLMARPLLHAMRAAHPAAEICAVAHRPLLDLLAPEHSCDAAEPWPSASPDRAALARRLREWRPDAALVLPFSFSSARFALATGAPSRIGYGHEARSFMLTRALRRPPRGEMHLSREYLALGASLGASEVPLPALPVTDQGRAEADALLAEDGERRPVALLAPRSAYGPARQWPVERFVALARTLIATGRRVLVCGTAAERDTCDQVAAGAGAGARSVAGRTTLPVLAALTAAADLAVCNDSGLAHLAGAVGTRTITLYGSTSSAWTAALGPRVTIVQHPPVCSPCFRRTCRIGYPCLTGIEVNEVLTHCGPVAG